MTEAELTAGAHAASTRRALGAGPELSTAPRNPFSRRPGGRRSRRYVVGASLASLLVITLQAPSSAQGDTSSSSQPAQQQVTTSTTQATTTTQAPATTQAPETTVSEPPSSDTSAPPATDGGGGGGGGGGATTTPPTTDKATAAAKARQLNVSTANLSDVADALKALNKQVTDQAAKSTYANQQLAAAEQKVKETDTAVADAEGQLNTLQDKLRGEAIRAFMGDGSEQAAVIVTGDPNQSIRMQTMLAEVTQTGVDLSTTLQTAHEDLEVQLADALNAKEVAESLKADAAKQLSLLQGDRQDQVKLAISAETRLEQLLSEEGGGSLANNPSTAAAWALVQELRGALPISASAPPPGQDIPIPASISAGDIVTVGGIQVHVSIAANVKRMLADAAAAGYNLGGGGYRDPAGQIAVRKSNCGSSNYAIYQMPASSCSPPTARPGTSMHEKGLAIDFNWNGDLIKSHSNPAWVWLNSHASAYGFYNLPSEPWHWSTTGD